MFEQQMGRQRDANRGQQGKLQDAIVVQDASATAAANANVANSNANAVNAAVGSSDEEDMSRIVGTDKQMMSARLSSPRSPSQRSSLSSASPERLAPQRWRRQLDTSARKKKERAEVLAAAQVRHTQFVEVWSVCISSCDDER